MKTDTFKAPDYYCFIQPNYKDRSAFMINLHRVEIAAVQ